MITELPNPTVDNFILNLSKIGMIKEDNDFYSLDVEGLEEGVLETVPWEKVFRLRNML